MQTSVVESLQQCSYPAVEIGISYCGGPQLMGPNIVGKNGYIDRFLCIPQVPLTMVPRNNTSYRFNPESMPYSIKQIIHTSPPTRQHELLIYVVPTYQESIYPQRSIATAAAHHEVGTLLEVTWRGESPGDQCGIRRYSPNPLGKKLFFVGHKAVPTHQPPIYSSVHKSPDLPTPLWVSFNIRTVSSSY